MHEPDAFQKQYDALNSEQRAAVDAIEGPVFVIAGPGTGKTQVLTLRIANILRLTDTPPDAILALTFTDAASSEMRERLSRIVGARASRIRIHTFHGFAESVIGRFPDRFPRIVGAHVATDAERAEIMDKALLGAPVELLRPFGDPLYYHPIAARAISTMKRERVTPEVLETRIAEAREAFANAEWKVHEKGKYVGQMKAEFVKQERLIQKTADLLQVYRAYEQGLTDARRYDFEDLILEVVRALQEDETFRLEVQEGILYVLADEHQDANRAQNAMLELVSGFFERPNLFIVGDEKQAVYRFQGADLDNVQYFRTKFEGTRVLTLVENYRSTQSILDTALSLVSASPDERLSRVPLIAAAGGRGKPISRIACPTQEVEMATLAARIRACIDVGTAPGQVAVLVRRNRDVGEVASALERAGIKVSGAGDDDALANRFVRALLRLMRVAANPRDEQLAGVLTLPGFALAASDIARITQHARKERSSILGMLVDAAALSAAKVQNAEGAHAVGSAVEELARLASYERPVGVAERALQLSGLLPKVLAAPDRAASLAAIRGLLHALEDLSRREHGASLGRALELLSLYETRGMSLSGRGSEDPTRVKVLTVHRSKGREFAQVFLPMLTERAWSTRARPEHFYLPDVLSDANEAEDERRLLYVGITRAKEHATITYALTDADGRSGEPSALLEDLDPALVETEEPVMDAEPAWMQEAPARPSGVEGDTPSEDDLTTLRATFLAQGLSPTALNNYLECPWKYFYVNLLRIPEAENKFMLFGTAMHAALKRYADERARGTDMGADGLVRDFMRSLERMPLAAHELEEMAKKGERALPLWWEARHDEWPEVTRAEQPIRAPFPLLDGTMLELRGALDRIDGDGQRLTVIDYKTGKSKSRNEIMGTTKEGNGNYYRQLTFYKLVLARSEEPLTMLAGVLEFIEPDEKGRIKSETFEVPNEDVAALEESIRAAAEAIMTLSFWNSPCDEEECPWCALRFGLA